MARTVASLPAGTRIIDYISLGMITKTFPPTTVRAVLAASGKVSLHERDLPAHVVVLLRHRPGALYGQWSKAMPRPEYLVRSQQSTPRSNGSGAERPSRLSTKVSKGRAKSLKNST